MVTIWKFRLPLKDNPTITMPIDAKVIHVGTQDNNSIQLWAEVESDNSLEERSFHIAGTGLPLPENSGHLGSVILNNGRFVWHVYESKYG